MNSCYLCAAPNAQHPLSLKPTFTNHSAARNPTSQHLCDRCAWCIPLRVFYWNEAKAKFNAIYSRNWSWLLNGDNSFPKFGESMTQGNDTLPVVTDLPTRIQIRDWLINPPQTPFTICIAESGQKHILPWALEANSRDHFPVQFEIDTVYIDRIGFIKLLDHYEFLLGLGFSKTEIDSGNYRSDRIAKVFRQYEASDRAIARERGTRLLQLISYVSQTPVKKDSVISPPTK